MYSFHYKIRKIIDCFKTTKIIFTDSFPAVGRTMSSGRTLLAGVTVGVGAAVVGWSSLTSFPRPRPPPDHTRRTQEENHFRPRRLPMQVSSTSHIKLASGRSNTWGQIKKIICLSRGQINEPLVVGGNTSIWCVTWT